MRRTVSSIALLAVTTIGSSAIANDWTRFRGDSGSGVAANQAIVTEIGPEQNVLWKMEAPEGTSSPIIVGERLFLTSHNEDQRSIHCRNAATGELLWEKSVSKHHAEIATPPAGPSTPTPVTDGERVFVYFPDTGIFAWTLDGEQIWNRPLEPSKTMHGLSSSLITFDGRVYMLVDQLDQSYLVALDATTGDEIWKQERISGLTGGYSTPVIHQPKEGPPLLITTGPFEVIAYNAASGERVWWILGRTNAPCSSPIVLGDVLYFCEPVGERLPMSLVGGLDANKDNQLDLNETEKNEAIRRLVVRIDDHWGNKDSIVNEDEWNKAFGEFEGKGGLTAVNMNGTGDVSDSAVIWNFTKGMPYIPGVLVDKNVVFAVDDGGVLTTIDATTGQQIHKGRLQQGNAQYYSSPVAAGEHVVLIDTAGILNIVSNTGDWKSVSHCDLGEPCFATPAIAGNRLYVRTKKSLYCFGKS